MAKESTVRKRTELYETQSFELELAELEHEMRLLRSEFRTFQTKLALVHEELLEQKGQQSQIKENFTQHKAEVEEALLYVLNKLSDSFFVTNINKIQSRLLRLEWDVGGINERLRRYTNFPGLRQLRALRRRFKRG